MMYFLPKVYIFSLVVAYSGLVPRNTVTPK